METANIRYTGSCARQQQVKFIAVVPWIRPTLEYDNILYSGAATTHLCCLDALQSQIEWTRVCVYFCANLLRLSLKIYWYSCIVHLLFNPFLIVERPAAIMGLVCHLLAGEGCRNLLNYCTQFCGNQTHRRSHRLHSWDPAGHLRLIDSCNFKTLDRLKHTQLAGNSSCYLE